MNMVNALVFKMGQAYYAINLVEVQEVSRMPDITTVPQADPFIMGMCSHRGQLITIVDLMKRFRQSSEMDQLVETGDTEPVKDHLIVITHDRDIVGLGISGVDDIIKMPESEVKAYPYAQSAYPGLIKGVLQTEKYLASWLDTKILFSLLKGQQVDQIEVHQAA